MKLTGPHRTRHQQRVIQHMEALCGWLTANAITPADVPIDARPTITGGQIRIEVYQVDPNGKLRLNGEGDAAEIARKTITRPLLVALPDDLAWWAA